MIAAVKTRKKNSHGPAQDSFIKATRAKVTLEPLFFQKNDWTRISRSHGVRNTCLNRSGAPVISVDGFHVKDLAVWMPHGIVKDHVPSCPHCGTSEFVQPTAGWVKRPKLLCGLRKHRYLDGIHCKCLRQPECEGHSFSGCDAKSLAQDGARVLGIFNFHLTAGCAVDEELHSHIVNHSKDATASIHRRLAPMTTDEWMEDVMFHCTAIREQQVKSVCSDTLLGDCRQRTLDSHLSQKAETPARKRRRIIQRDVTRVEREIAAKRQVHEEDVEFVNVFKMKENRNKIGLPFKGLGKTKILTLIGCGMTTAREPLDHNGGDPIVLPQWKPLVENHCKNLEVDIAVLTGELARLQESLEWNDLEIDFEEDSAGDGDGGNDVDGSTSDTERLIPPFSPLTDSERHNGRVVSKSAIDRTVATDFQHRKPLQLDKMRGHKADVLKIDWHHKLPAKIRVCTGKGKSFAPFKSAVSIHTEDTMTIFWKCHPCSEGIETVRPDLERLNERLHIVQGRGPKVICVDNCCSVRSKLQSIFGDDVLALLDTFHWMKRWDGIMNDVNSAESSTLRGLLHKALFIVESSECNRVKLLLRRKLRREPLAKETLKDAKATIPEAETLLRRVDAVAQCVAFCDLSNQMPPSAKVTGPAATVNGAVNRQRTNRRGRYLKPMNREVLKLIGNQMDHVRKGCMSDPHKSIVRIHRVNPMNGKAHAARSTGSNENDNVWLNRLLNAPSVGIARAERVASDHCEESNGRKEVSRLGGEEQLTQRTEKPCAINSVATSVGFTGEDLPVTEKVQVPTAMRQLKECIGMEHELPERFNVEVDDGDDTAEVQEEAAETDLANFLAGIAFDEEDVHVDTLQFGDAATVDTVEPTPVVDMEAETAVHLPQINPNETTFQTHKRLTSQQPWVPFQLLSKPRSDLEDSECDFFKQEESKCDRNGASLHSKRGYGTFAEAWDMEVATRFKAKAGCDDSVVLIYRKSALQLQQHHDRARKHMHQASLVRPNDQC